MDNIIVALIAGGCSVIGVVISNVASNAKIAEQLKAAQGITNTNLDNIRDNVKQLAEEVRRHNSFGDRITACEAKIQEIIARQERMDTKIEHLREYHETK
jgi:uncharacterized protein YlxW (UPF0749 family)